MKKLNFHIDNLKAGNLSPCLFCNKHCCKELLITINIFDAIRISNKLNKPVDTFAELVEPRILNVNWSTVLECDEGSYILALKSRPCIFFKNGKCSIFDVAPLSCKIYPHSLGGFNSNATCPPISKNIFRIYNPGKKYISKFRDEYTKYKKIVAAVNGMSLKKADCLDTLEKKGRAFEKD